MVAAQSDRHHVGTAMACFGRLVDNEPFLGASHSQDARLGWVNNGREIADSEHAQIGDGERATLQKNCNRYIVQIIDFPLLESHK